MPYVPQANGETIWVDSEDEANQKYAESFNVDVPETEVSAFEGISKTGAEKEDEKKAGIFEPVRIAAHGLTGVPGDLYGLGQKIGIWGMQPGNLLWGAATLGKSEEDKARIAANVKAETEALQKLGVRADGSAYGLPKQFGIWSDNSKLRTDWLEPRTGWGKLGSNIVSVLASAYVGGGGGAARTTAVLQGGSKVSPAFKLANAMKLPAGSAGIKGVARGAVIFTVKDLIPNALEDVAYFQPGANKEVGGALAAIAELPEEDRRLAVQALLAETDTEFDYTMESIKEVAGGAVSLGVLRGIFGTARRFLKRAPKEIPTVNKDGTPVAPEVKQKAADKILNEELDKELPNMVQEIDADNASKAEIGNNNEIGRLNTQLRNQTDKLSRDTSLGAHAIAESFLNKSEGSPLFDDITKIDELGDQISKRQTLTYTDARIAELQKQLQKGAGKGEFSPEEVPIFRQLIEKELADMQAKIDEQPIQYQIGKRGKPTKKRIPGSGWLSTSANSRRFNQYTKLLQDLDEFQKLSEGRTKYLEGRTSLEAQRDQAYKDLTDFYGVGEEGFRKFVQGVRKELNILDKTNADRMSKVDDQNRLFADLGRTDEITELNPQGDPFYQSYYRLRELIEEAEGKDSFDVEFIEEFVRRSDEIHNAVVKAGGIAPTSGQAAKALEQMKAEEGVPSVPKLSIKNIDPAAEGFDEIQKALEEGTQESVENVAKAVSEHYGVPYEEALEGLNGGKAKFGEYLQHLEENRKNAGDWGEGPGDPEDIIQPKRSEVSNSVPINSEGKINNDLIAINRASKGIPGLGQMDIPVYEATKGLNKDNNFLQKLETDDDVAQVGKAIADQVEEMQRLAANGSLNEDAFAKFDWFNTSTLKYAADLDDAAVVKFAVEELGKRGFKISRHALVASRNMLVKLAEAPELIDDVLGEGAAYAEGVKAGLPWIIVTTSMIENNSKRLLKTSRMLQDARLGLDPGGGYQTDEALQNFKDAYVTMMANVKVVSALFESFGNGLRLMKKNNRLAFEQGRPDVTIRSFKEMTSKWNDVDEYTKSLADVTKTANEEVSQVFDEFIKKVESGEEISEAEWNGIDNLVARVHDAQGDLTKLKELEVTGPMVLRTVQSGGMISSPMTISSIPPQAMGELAIRQTGMTFSSWQNLAMERWIRNNTGEEYVEALNNARFHTRIWKNIAFGIQESWPQVLARWQYGRSITDPGVFNKAAEIGAAGVKREQQILDEKRALEIKLPFIDVILKKDDFERKEIFNALNEMRISLKVFHDYAIAGEAWNKRHWAAKWILAPSVSAARQLPGLGHLGTKSYYANGEMVNMTAPFQFSALGDEFLAAAYSNAAIKTKIEIDVDERIVAGLLDEADRAEEIKKLLSKSNEDFYAPVTAGLDNEVIGHQVIEKQLDNVMEIAREVNRTEELTGPFAAAGKWINFARYHEGAGYSPQLQLFANTMAGVVTSPLNSIKWGLRWGLGLDIYQAGIDAARIGIAKAGDSKAFAELSDYLPGELQKRVTQNAFWTKNLRDFESKYFSSDINVRTKAQGALAVATGMHAMAYMHLMDPNLEITGGLENTYRSEKGQVGLYTMKVEMPWGSMRVPYRWIPVYGSVLAIQATMRDIDEFGIQQGEGGFDLFGAVAAATASYIMETPGAASFDRLFKAVEGARTGNADKLTDFVGQAIAGMGEPYYQFRKFMAEGFDPRKPAKLGAKYDVQEFWLNNPEAVDNPIWSVFRGVGGSFGSAFAHSYEYNAFGFLTDEVVNIIQGHPEGRNRRALWFGKPGETINVKNAGKWNGLRAVFGRYMPYPNDLDSVGTEIINNLIQGPRADFLSGKDYGIKGVSKRVVNDFEHFLNEEFTYYDAATGITHVGINSIIKDFVESDYYQALPGLSSPYASTGYSVLPGIKLPFAPTPPNWDTKNNQRRTLLQGLVRTMINKAKEDFVMGDYEGQQYKASEELKQTVLKHRRGLLTGGI